ncbi:hypothetical protein H8356DRAFT_1352589 [Neocallimastix lanati (nom. inval.)]|nr:hypothetical protein H8356DRAFT_1352589 [Neocallimastix sp. JGI-2020a]
MLGFSTSLTNVDYYLNLEFTSKSDNNLSIKRVVINTKMAQWSSSMILASGPNSILCWVVVLAQSVKKNRFYCRIPGYHKIIVVLKSTNDTMKTCNHLWRGGIILVCQEYHLKSCNTRSDGKNSSIAKWKIRFLRNHELVLSLKVLKDSLLHQKMIENLKKIFKNNFKPLNVVLNFMSQDFFSCYLSSSSIFFNQYTCTSQNITGWNNEKKDGVRSLKRGPSNKAEIGNAFHINLYDKVSNVSLIRLRESRSNDYDV